MIEAVAVDARVLALHSGSDAPYWTGCGAAATASRQPAAAWLPRTRLELLLSCWADSLCGGFAKGDQATSCVVLHGVRERQLISGRYLRSPHRM